jgi:UPF0716 protein FxsA
MSVQNRLRHGEMPAQQILEGVMLAVSGVLLLTPGFMTDAMGMVVLLPVPRAMLAKYLMTKVVVKSMGNGFHAQGGFTSEHFHSRPGRDNPFSSEEGNTFEGEFERKDDNKDNNKLN